MAREKDAADRAAEDELWFVYVVGGGPEPLVVWPGQIGCDILAAGGHTASGIASIHRVLLDGDALVWVKVLKGLDEAADGAISDLFAAIHAVGVAHAARQDTASRR